MASAIFKPSRIVAVALVAGAVLWIVSGVFGSHDEPATEAEAPAQAATPIQKVSVTSAIPEQHERTIVLSCVTSADHRATAVARGEGIIVDLKVRRGSVVRAGEPIAAISDEGREAAVKEAEAVVAQRKAEYEANKKLIDQGTAPRNTLPGLEAAVAAAESTLASARADVERLVINSPIDGIVDSVPLQLGQAVQAGTEIAEVVDPDPMLAVGAVAENRRNSLQIGQNVAVRFIDGSHVTGTISFVSLSAETATRTYRVEARMVNPDAAIADGVTCEMAIALEPIAATAVPRSALVFSDSGELGVRVADADSKAQFVPVEIVDDGRESVWVTGIDGATRVIVVGQDFVKDGDPVEAVSAAEANKPAEPPA
jgi:multidrug efflux system membrane fusion protein